MGGLDLEVEACGRFEALDVGPLKGDFDTEFAQLDRGRGDSVFENGEFQWGRIGKGSRLFGFCF